MLTRSKRARALSSRRHNAEKSNNEDDDERETKVHESGAAPFVLVVRAPLYNADGQAVKCDDGSVTIDPSVKAMRRAETDFLSAAVRAATALLSWHS